MGLAKSQREVGGGSGLTHGGVLMAWLSPILETFPITVPSRHVSSTMIAPVSSARSDGTANYTRCAVKLTQLGYTFWCQLLASLFLTHVPHETTVCPVSTCGSAHH